MSPNNRKLLLPWLLLAAIAVVTLALSSLSHKNGATASLRAVPKSAMAYAQDVANLECRVNKQPGATMDNEIIVAPAMLFFWHCGTKHGQVAFQMQGKTHGDGTTVTVGELSDNVDVTQKNLTRIRMNPDLARRLLSLRDAAEHK